MLIIDSGIEEDSEDIMSDTHRVPCPWCGEENTITIKIKDEAFREVCSSCNRGFYIFQAEHGIVVSPLNERAWIK